MSNPLKIRSFRLTGGLSALALGALQPLSKGVAAADFEAPTVTPSRPLHGWLMTYGKIDAGGQVVPTVDRDGQVAEVARELGHIDWQPYVKGGAWNDTHNESGKDPRFGQIVGVPLGLQFHSEDSPFAQAHGKVGFYTWGYLFDRAQPQNYRGHAPTPRDLKRADRFWALAKALEPTGRSLGLSAHGMCALSPCGKRIVWAQVNQAAVCELPKNPDASLEIGHPLELGLTESPLAWLRKGMASASDKACGRCSCPPGVCAGAPRPLRLSMTSANLGAVVPEDLEAAGHDTAGDGPTKFPALEKLAGEHGLSVDDLRSLVRRLAARMKTTPEEAARALVDLLHQREKAA